MYAKIYHSSVCTQYVIYHFDKVSFSHLVHAVFFFFFIYFYQLEASYFTLLQWFLPYIDMNQPWIYMRSPSRSPLPPSSLPHPSGSSQCTSPEHPSHASNLGWRSVSPLIVYLFQCCSLRTSHPRLLPQSPKVCSVHLCLFFLHLGLMLPSF